MTVNIVYIYTNYKLNIYKPDVKDINTDLYISIAFLFAKSHSIVLLAINT
jgi:hypothetical protein